MDEWSLFEALAFEPDILLNILNYLTLTEINKLESSSKRFEIILDKICFWERKIKKEFKQYSIDLERNDVPIRDIYWELRYLGHLCSSNYKCYNLCNICLAKTLCFNITKCSKCKTTLC